MTTPRKSRKTRSCSHSRLTRPRIPTLAAEQIAQISTALGRLAALEGRVAQLESERQNHLGPQPHNPTPFPYDPTPFLPIVSEDRCPKCGLKIEGCMGYVCPRTDCPNSMGPVMSGGANSSQIIS